MSLTISLPIPKKKKSQQIDIFDVPKLEHQAEIRGWSGGVYNFRTGIAPNQDYFNPTLVDRPDGRWLIVRRSERRADMPVGFNDLVAFQLRDNLPVRGFPLPFKKSYPTEHVEDGRATYFNGKTYVGACNFYMPNPRQWSGAHQIFGQFAAPDSKNPFGAFEKRFDPDYGNNGSSLNSTGRKNQKNWTLFFFDGKPHILYSASPHIVVEVDFNFKVVKEHITTPDLSVWKYGEIRGGTPPVLHDGLYWTIFHSSIPWLDGKKQYHSGAYAFEPNPPFKVVKITPEPFLSGSRYDLWHPNKPLVVFPCGKVLEKNNDWLISFGINDLQSGWARIPHDSLLKLLVPV